MSARALEKSGQARVLHKGMHEHDMVATASRLSDDALIARVKLLAARERGTTAELVAHLAALEARKGYLAEGWGSLFEYCRHVLGLSEDAAFNRVKAARVALKYPMVVPLMAAGSLSVTTVRMLRDVLTPENHVAVIAEAKNASKREVEVMVARLAPREDVGPSIRKVAPPSHPAPVPAPVSSPLPFGRAGSAPPATVPIVPPPPGPRPVVAPLSPERYRMQFTVSKDAHDT